MSGLQSLDNFGYDSAIERKEDISIGTQLMPAPDATLLEQYEQLKNGSAFARLDSTVIEITGEDRQAFLHNFCTNDIKGLATGHACEAFVLNGKGKTIAHVHVLNVGDALVLHGVAGIGGELMVHLDRYIIREDVQLTDVSANRKVAFAPGESKLDANAVSFDANANSIQTHVEIAGFGELFIVEPNSAIDGTEVPVEALDMLRVEKRTPWFGRDINDSNLPQELLRDDKAISFNKGCYLGQETVARIDAMGKVNRVLVPVSLESEHSAGSELTVGEKTMGQLTSVAWSPARGSWIAMAMVRRPNEVAGSVLKCGDASVTVIQ